MQFLKTNGLLCDYLCFCFRKVNSILGQCYLWNLNVQEDNSKGLFK